MDTKLDSAVQSALMLPVCDAPKVKESLWTHVRVHCSESHMDTNISFQEVCSSTDLLSRDAQRKCRFSCVSEILFIHVMLNHKLHFLKTHTDMYASVYLTG